MALTTQSGANSGAKPPYYVRKTSPGTDAGGMLATQFYSSGEPVAAAAPSSGVDGAALTSYAGQYPFNNPASGNTYLYRWDLGVGLQASGSVGAIFLADRLWHNSDLVVTTTTAQAISSPTWPARDMDASTNGRGVMVGMEITVATTNGSPITNCTLEYTNSAGTASRTATITSIPAGTNAGTFIQFELQAGDEGVRSIQGITLGTSFVTGTIHLVAYRVLDICCNRSLIGGGSGAVVNGMPVRNRDMHAAGFVRLWDNTVPFSFQLLNAGTGVTQMGVFQVAQG